MSAPLAMETEEQRIVTRERLRLLVLGYYIRGGASAAFVSIFLIHFFVFLGFSFVPESAWNTPPQPTTISQSAPLGPSSTPSKNTRPSQPPVILFRIVAGVIGVIIFVGWTFGALTAYAGRCIQKRKHKAFVYIMAGANCIFIPYGTLLGVGTFIVMESMGGREEFRGPSIAAAD
jgi:hypothetical protein